MSHVSHATHVKKRVTLSMFLHGVFDGPGSPIKLGNLAPGRVLGSLAKTLPSASESQEPLAENCPFDSVSLGSPLILHNSSVLGAPAMIWINAHQSLDSTSGPKSFPSCAA